jgi:hypothetical protein
LAKTLNNTGAYASNTATNYLSLNGSNQNNTTETRKQVIMRSAGVWSDLRVRIQTNSTTGSSTVKSRINAADGTQIVTIGAGATGLFSDTTNSDSIAAGDKINWKVTPGSAHTLLPSSVSSSFAATSNTVKKMIHPREGLDYTANASARYVGISDWLFTPTATEANTQTKFRAAGTLKNGQINVFSNARAIATVYSSRINGADGTISVSATALTTGFFEDTVHTDTIASGDLVNWKILGGAEANSITVDSLSFEFETTDTKFQISTGGNGPESNNAGLTSYTSIEGRAQVVVFSVASTQVDATSPSIYYLSNLSIYLSAHTGTQASTFDLQVNGSGSALTITLPTATTGYFEDTTNNVTIAAGDLLNYRMASAADSTPTFTMMNMVASSTPATSVKTVNGLARASVKTRNGLAIASIKTINGLA